MNADAKRWHPDGEPDGSNIGINYVDAWIKPLNIVLEDGTKIVCKRRGLKLTAKVGGSLGPGSASALGSRPWGSRAFSTPRSPRRSRQRARH